MIPVSVLITTLNEAENLPRCLAALQGFDEVVVIDSGSDDGTPSVAESFGVRVEIFNWNGAYPKKRQWCLDHLDIKHDFVFFVDADEVVTPQLVREIAALDFKASGYFVRGQYVWGGRPLTYGLQNNKLTLFHRHKVAFPVIDDLDIAGMGEIEGHYQPVLKEGNAEQLRQPLLHYACEDKDGWNRRHHRYARWEAEMIVRKAYPKDVSARREILKNIFRRLPGRGIIAFLHSYIFKRGFLDGRAGYQFALSRFRYYRMVSAALKTNKA